MLEIRNLTKYYGAVRGVEELSLSLKRGEAFGFIGPNGAGKSTTIRSVMNLINKTSGQVFVDGKEFTKNDVLLKRQIGYLPSEVCLYDDLTVKGIFDQHESFYVNFDRKNGLPTSDIRERRLALVQALQLDETKKLEDLSLGNLKKVGIILAMMHRPKLLILDEPTSGLDPIMQNVFYELLLEEKKQGTTIFYSTHILSEVSKICDRVGILRQGRLVAVEEVDSLSDKNLAFVTLRSEQAEQIVQELGVQVISREHGQIKFANDIPDDRLIKVLALHPIDKLLIEEASLEELFLHYYRED